MKKLKLILLLLMAGLSFTSVIAQWTLVWSDEFDGSSVNTANWSFDIGTGSSGWGNNELEYYRQENATVSSGYLQITAKQESYGGMSYTSARMKTEGLVSVGPYGKIEARILAPSFTGSWPAFWMLGNNFSSVGWPSCGEIDILEHVNTESVSYSAIHWLDNNSSQADYSGSVSNDVTQWHVYSLEWDEQYLVWYLDGVEYFRADITNSINGTDEFHNSFFILLNLAVGGNWPGSTVDISALPATMYVDYVRVYSASGSTTCDPTSITPYIQVNDGSWQQTSSVTVNSGDKVILGPQPASGGSWSWSGCGTSGSSREQTIYPTSSCTAIATYTNSCGTQSTQNFNITVSSSGGGTTTGCSGSASDYSYSISASSIDFQSNVNSSWVDAHYTIDGGGQLNVRMTSLGSGDHTYPINVSVGSTVSVWFTYEKNGLAYDSPTYDCTIGSSSSGSGPSDAYYNVVVQHSGKYLDVAGASQADGANVLQWTANGGNNQKWLVENTGNGEYRLLAGHSGKALQVDGTSDGSNVIQTAWNNSNAQKFTFEDMNDGYYRIHSVANSNLCLDVSGASTSNGANVQVWSCHSNQNQRWSLNWVATKSTVQQDKSTEGENLILYPNPLDKGILHILMDNPDQEAAYLEVFTIQGQSIYSKTFYSSTINLASDEIFKSSGVYFIRIRMNGKSMMQKLMVK